MIETDLWGGLEFGEAALDPRAILVQQATLLERKSGGILLAEITSSSSDNRVLAHPTRRGAVADSISTAQAQLTQTIRAATAPFVSDSPPDDLTIAKGLLQGIDRAATVFHRHAFDIRAPLLGYTLRLLEVEHLTVAPPIRIVSDILSYSLDVFTKEAYYSAIQHVMTAMPTKIVLKTLFDKVSSLDTDPPEPELGD